MRDVRMKRTRQMTLWFQDSWRGWCLSFCRSICPSMPLEDAVTLSSTNSATNLQDLTNESCSFLLLESSRDVQIARDPNQMRIQRNRCKIVSLSQSEAKKEQIVLFSFTTVSILLMIIMMWCPHDRLRSFLSLLLKTPHRFLWRINYCLTSLPSDYLWDSAEQERWSIIGEETVHELQAREQRRTSDVNEREK